jgi:hypothetical protein
MTYTDNTSIPSEVIAFFKVNSEQGRVLSIKSPEWIYVLPYYTNQPLIDGWYPQGKLLQPLLEINDYKINDLYSTLQEGGEAEQDRVWLNLIHNASDLGISWVMIGDDDKRHLMMGTDFTLVAEIEGIFIYKFTQLSPDHLTLNVEDVREKVNIVVKVADFPGWTLRVDNVLLEHSQTEIGFITFSLPPRSSYRVDLTYERQGLSYLWVSLAGILLLAGFYVSSKILRQ